VSDSVTIGINILETLTTGMYRDPLVIFREYIQNACDSIDYAVDRQLFDFADGQVDIVIKDNTVTIEDNAYGLPSADFKQTLYSIGESNKIAGQNKGFRGIGHWCGFAHCSTLVFTAKAAGESAESVMKCDAQQIRSMMLDHRLKRKHYSIDKVLSSTCKFSSNEIGDLKSHYFKVEMFDVVDAKEELCNLQKVKDYLSFVIPVGYATEFRFRNEIHKFSNEIGQPIQEYRIYVNGEAVLKKYQPSFTTHGRGEDTITGVKCKEFKDDSGTLIAWMWFGVSNFKAQMTPANKMRGIRLRSHNIQIGSEDALQKLFNESNGRGLYYFIGEVFAVSNDLLPDSQRDYFESGEARTKFESLLYDFFNIELKNIYYGGSRINSAYDKINKAALINEEISKVLAEGREPSEEQYGNLNKAQEDAQKAEIALQNLREKFESKSKENNLGTDEVVLRDIIQKRDEYLPKFSSTHSSSKSKMGKEKTTVKLVKQPEDKLVSLNMILSIIRSSVDTSIAEDIIAKIEKELP